MAIDEHARHQLYTTLEEKIGSEPAATLMGLLPPVGWADVATKRDLDQFELRFDLKVEKVEARLGERLEKALKAQAFRFMTFVTTLVIGTAAAALTIARLT
jgi:hypothetical protein